MAGHHPVRIDRRRVLALAGLGTAGAALGGAGLVAAVWRPWDERLPTVTGEPLRQPVVVASRDGVLDLTLTAAAGVRLAGRDSAGLGFNGTSPGPTLRLRPGDVARLRLVNRLNQPTNLHTHGLHVSPLGSGDNPFIMIEPGGSFDYTIQIPPEHPPGTYWYHPHHHGTVADQVFAGLVGALLVEGGPDLSATADRVLLVTDTTLDSSGRVRPADPMTRMAGREGELVLVNGEHQPIIALATGALERWRVINGCVSRVLALRLAQHPLTQIALDGAFLAAPVDRDRVVLAPGNRADLLVRPTRAGRYPLVSEPYDRGGAGMMGGPARSSAGVTLATMVSSGPPVAAPTLPARLPAPVLPSGSVLRRRELVFSMTMPGMPGMGPGRVGMGGMGFVIDGRTFDPDRDDQAVVVGTTEEWTVVNTSPMDHPFHLHVWPFQVIAASTGTPPAGVRQDVVLVPARGWVRLRIPFTDYAGRSVYHCHILDHEDLGMMGTINVHG